MGEWVDGVWVPDDPAWPEDEEGRPVVGWKIKVRPSEPFYDWQRDTLEMPFEPSAEGVGEAPGRSHRAGAADDTVDQVDDGGAETGELGLEP